MVTNLVIYMLGNCYRHGFLQHPDYRLCGLGQHFEACVTWKCTVLAIKK